MNRHASLVTVLAVVVAAGAAPSQAQEPACVVPPLSAQQHRVVEKAAQGIDELRRYVYISQATRALYLPDVVAWIDARRIAERRCALAAADVTRR